MLTVWLVIAGVLLPSGATAQETGGGDFACTVVASPESIVVEWSGVPAAADAVIVERNVFGKWYWRGRVAQGSAADDSFTDQPLPHSVIRVAYRVAAKSGSSVLESVACGIGQSEGLSCEVTQTADGFEVRYSASLISSDGFVRVFRRVTDDGSLYQRTREAPADVFIDRPSPTGVADYFVFEDGPRSPVVRAAACRDGSTEPPVEPPTPECSVLEAIYEAPPFQAIGDFYNGADGRLYFDGGPELIAYDPDTGVSETIRYRDQNIPSNIIGADQEGNLYFTSSVLGGPGSPLFFYDMELKRVRRADLRPAGLWGLREIAFGDDGLVYLYGRLGSRDNALGFATYDPSTNKATEVDFGITPEAVALAPSVGELVLAGAVVDNESRVYLYDGADGSVEVLDRGRSLLTGRSVRAPDGRLFLSLRGDSAVFDPRARELRSVDGPVPPGSTAQFLTVRGERIINFSFNQRGAISIWDVAEDRAREIQISSRLNVPRAFVESPDGLVYFMNYTTDLATQGLWTIDPVSGSAERVLAIGREDRARLTTESIVGPDGRIYFGSETPDVDALQVFAFDPSC